ncbi:MAG: toprim domain-containing protein [Deltaproteobacteria bacterium]|nr:toprim domain-containing protein [Deltaproteobacteria bacterium]
MISPETIAAVKERVDVVAVVGETVALRRAGRTWKGLCPFHKEKSPSFHVNPERGYFHCFGCGEKGSAIDFLIKLEGHTFPEAVRILAERFGVEVVETGAADPDRARYERQKREKDDLHGVMRLAAAFYVEQLQRHPLASIARAELARRGLPHDTVDQVVRQALDGFHVGYAPYGWDGLARYLERQGVSADLASRLELIRPRQTGKGHYDLFRHRLMFAVLDRMGRVVAFSGRALEEPGDDELRRAGLEPLRRAEASSRDEGRAPPKYVNSPETPIYVKGDTVFGLHQARHAIRDAQQAILVEGNFDVLALHARGLINVVAPLGTAFTPAQARLVRKYAPTAVVMFDGDQAGRKATVAVRGPALEAGLGIRVANLPAGADPDDYSRAHGIDAVRRVVSASQGMLEYLLDRAFEGIKTGSADEIGACLKNVRRYLSEESDADVRAMAKAYADRLAGKVLVNGRPLADMRALERTVEGALARPSAGPGVPSRREDARPASPSSRSRVLSRAIDEAVLGALLDFPGLLADPEVEAALLESEGELALAVAVIRQAWERECGRLAHEVLDELPRSVHAFASGRLAAPRFSEAQEARAELMENAKKLKGRSMQVDRAAALEQMQRASRLGDREAEDELLRALALRSKEKLGLN